MIKKQLLAFLLAALLLCGCTISIEPFTSEPAPATGSGLTVHFLDVGQADCTLLECDGEYMLIDGGNVDDGQFVVTYLQEQGVEELSHVVCTHAHEDHVGGLASVLAVFPTGAVLSPTTTHSSRCFDDFMYYADQQRIAVTIPTPGDTFTLGQAEVTVLGPVKTYPDPNNTSIVLRVEYGTTSFLFTGDMETLAENDMLDNGAYVRADVLKAGHHGSSTSTGYRFLYEVNPTYTVISCGIDNSYGHPHDEVVSRFHDAGVPMFRTDELGTVVAFSDGAEISFTWERQQNKPAEVEPAEQQYIGNVNSHKFHCSDCSGLPAEKNRIYFDSYLEAIGAGYTPCSSCLP